MSRKTDQNSGAAFAPAIAADLAKRQSRRRAALAEAETALAAGEAQDAERRAKALSAIAKAAVEVEQWRAAAMATRWPIPKAQARRRLIPGAGASPARRRRAASARRTRPARRQLK